MVNILIYTISRFRENTGNKILWSEKIATIGMTTVLLCIQPEIQIRNDSKIYTVFFAF